MYNLHANGRFFFLESDRWAHNLPLQWWLPIMSHERSFIMSHEREKWSFIMSHEREKWSFIMSHERDKWSFIMSHEKKSPRKVVVYNVSRIDFFML